MECSCTKTLDNEIISYKDKPDRRHINIYTGDSADILVFPIQFALRIDDTSFDKFYSNLPTGHYLFYYDTEQEGRERITSMKQPITEAVICERCCGVVLTVEQLIIARDIIYYSNDAANDLETYLRGCLDI